MPSWSKSEVSTEVEKMSGFPFRPSGQSGWILPPPEDAPV